MDNPTGDAGGGVDIKTGMLEKIGCNVHS